MQYLALKRNILIISGVYTLYFLVLFLVSLWCSSSWCRVHDDDLMGRVLFVLMPLLPLFLFSLISYKMRDEVFQAWWNFARWWVPVIIVSTFLLDNASGTGGGYLGMGQDFIFLIQGILYTILILGSLWKITRTHLRLNQAGN